MKKIVTFIMVIVIMAIGASSVSAYATYPAKTFNHPNVHLKWNIPIKKDDVITIDFIPHAMFVNQLNVNGLLTDMLDMSAEKKRNIVNITMTADRASLVVHGTSDNSQQAEVFSVKVNGVEANELEAGAPPLTPANLKAVASNNSVALNWGAVTGVLDFAGYNVYRDGVKVNTVAITDTTYTASVANDVQHRWQVSAYRTLNGNNIESEKSAEVMTFFDSIPNPPTNLMASGGLESVDLSWIASNIPDFAGYNVYSNSGKLNTLLLTVPRYSGSLAAGNYQFNVTTVDLAGNESERSNTAIANVTEKVPTAPKGLKAESIGEEIKVKWDANSEFSVIGYKIYIDDKLFTSLNKDELSLEFTGLEVGINYKFSVAAYTLLDTTSQKSSVTASVLDTVPPANVKNFIALAGNEAAMLYWTANKEKDLAGYNIYVDDVLHTAVAKHDVSYLIKNLTNDTEYQIQIAAIDTSGNESNRSAKFLVTPNGLADITAPAKPMDLVGVAEGKEIVLNWTANSELDLVGYFVYLDNVKVNYAPIENTDFVISNLELDTKYRIYVTAIDTAGNESASSNVITVMTAAMSAPLKLKASKEEQQVVLSWKAPNDLVEYYIVYKNGIRIAQTTELEFTDGALEVGEAYKYEVSAMYADGESKKAYVGVRMSSGNEIEFDNNASSLAKSSDVLGTAFNFLNQYGVWIVGILAVMFAPLIFRFLLFIFDVLSGKQGKRKRAAEAAAQAKKEELSERRRKQAKERKLWKVRDEKYDYLTKNGRISQRDAYVKQVGYLDKEQRAEKVRAARVENLAKARSERSKRAASGSGGRGSRSTRKAR